MLDEEKSIIVDFKKNNPEIGYRRLSYILMDENKVYVSPSSVRRALEVENLLGPWDNSPSRKGKGFEQPKQAHEHWHVDISYINVAGTFYYLCSVLDGYSRYIVSHDIKESMKEADVEVIIQKGKEKFFKATPRIISDNGPQFIAKEFKSFIRTHQMTHVRTSPYYPQSNGKIERWHKSLKSEKIRTQHMDSFETAKTSINQYVDFYNEVRLHSAIGYVTPKCKLEGKEQEIFEERKHKLELGKHYRKQKWVQIKSNENLIDT